MFRLLGLSQLTHFGGLSRLLGMDDDYEVPDDADLPGAPPLEEDKIWWMINVKMWEEEW